LHTLKRSFLVDYPSDEAQNAPSPFVWYVDGLSALRKVLLGCKELYSRKLSAIMSIILSIMYVAVYVASLFRLVKGKISEHYSIKSNSNNIDNIVNNIYILTGATTL
jgi:hypothetical protein